MFVSFLCSYKTATAIANFEKKSNLLVLSIVKYKEYIKNW